MKHFIITTGIIFIVASHVCAATMLGVQEIIVQSHSLSKECIDEPVFNRSACIYQTNKVINKIEPVVGPLSEICRNTAGRIYEGDYDTLDLVNCSHVVIRNANIKNLIIKSSTVSIENSEIVSEQTAMDVTGSDVVITASKLMGETAIISSGSRLDLAGVTLIGEQYSVSSDTGSSIVFSVSSIDSHYDTRRIHEFVKVSIKNPL